MNRIQVKTYPYRFESDDERYKNSVEKWES